MSAQRWIHCGLCNSLQADNETKFYHLSCADILCRSCMSKTNRGTSCPVCKRSLDHFIELGDEMSRKEKMLYHPSPVSFYQIAAQTLAFQHKHRQQLVQAILKARESLHRLDELETQIRQKIVETQKRYENMRLYRRSLQENMRQTIVSSGRSSTAVDTMRPEAAGGFFQRRVSTHTPSSVQPSSSALQSQRRFSMDSFNLDNSVKMSQANSSTDSGIGLTPSSDACSVGSGRPMSSSTPKTISPIKTGGITQRRTSIAVGGGLQTNYTPFKAPRRYSTTSFKQFIGGQSTPAGGRSNPGETLSSSLFMAKQAATTAISSFYMDNKK
ncbi:RING finger protein narya-like [Anopheles stephensi]|uniref:RING finger protein narya-like n=1 Tax=Anopheles stephensi TaxID=30069 RepID=UPI001658BA0B|nr:RING finger protein narya-like [Anopheles stephensi]XP_035918869.1 RING finger protein narya-like [Anopheles stephensi]